MMPTNTLGDGPFDGGSSLDREPDELCIKINDLRDDGDAVFAYMRGPRGDLDRYTGIGNTPELALRDIIVAIASSNRLSANEAIGRLRFALQELRRQSEPDVEERKAVHDAH
jgi:hypothetical protein